MRRMTAWALAGALAGALPAVAAPATAAPAKIEELKALGARCIDEESTDARTRVAACTALIDTGRLSKDDLLSALSFRISGNVELGEYRAVLVDADRAIALHPEAGFYVNRGFAKSRLGDLQAALADYNEAIRLDPKLARAYANRGAVYYRLRDYKRALADLDLAIMMEPNRAKPLSNRGLTRMQLGDDKGALEDFNRAIELSPQDPTLLTNRGQLYSRQGEHSLGLADYNAALQVNPRLPTTLTMRGNTFLDLGQDDRAAADFDAAVHADPQDADAAYGRCYGYIAMGRNLMSAKGSCDDAVRLDPNDPDFPELRGLVKLILHDDAGALADYDLALKLGGPDAERLYGRGVALKRLGRSAEGEAEMAKGRRLDASIERSFANLDVRP